MGLPRRKVDNPGTIFGIEVDEPRWSLDPRLRRDMMQEQEMAMQEDALAAQQAQLARQNRIMEAEDRAISGIEAGEDIGNIFKNNPSLALSRNFGQFANMAEMARPSKAAQSMIPSLAMKLPIEERGVFNELVNQPEFANNPFAAYDEAQRRGSRSKQHGELVKAGVPLAKIDQTKDYSPIEFEDLVRQHKKPETGNDFTDKLVQQAWSGFDENYMPPEGVDDPVEIAIDMADKKNSIRQRIMEKYGAAPAIPGAATATNITSPAAMSGAPAPFMDTMKKGAGQVPKVEDILKVTDEEVIKDINSPDATEDTFMAALSDPNSSEKVKTTALERLRQFAKEPKFPLGTTSREARNRIANLQEKIKEGEKLIRMGPEMERYRKAWTAEKEEIAKDIEDYAKSIGLNADLVAADLAKNEPLTEDPDNPFTIRDDFNRFLKGKLDRKSIKISPFEGSEFASELGMEGVIPGFRSIGKGKTYSDVLDAYLGEKFGQNQPAPSNPVASTVKPSNIKSITPIE